MAQHSNSGGDGFLPVAAGVMVGMMFFSAGGEPRAAGILDQAFRLADIAKEHQSPIKEVLLDRDGDCGLLEADLRSQCVEVRQYASKLGLDL